MSNIVIEHDEFNTTKNGFSIVAVIFSLLLLLANIFAGLISIALTLTMIFFNVGIEIDSKAQKFRYFKSFFGYKTGKWDSLEKYEAQIILKKNLNGEVLSPKLVTALQYKKIVFDVNLTNKSHRARLSLKKFKTLDAARAFAADIENKLKLPLETYNPVISKKTRLRRESRRR